MNQMRGMQYSSRTTGASCTARSLKRKDYEVLVCDSGDDDEGEGV